MLFSLRKRMMYFNPEDGGNSGGSGVPAPQTAGNGNGAGAGGEAKTYTQSELDRLFTERASQAERSLLKKLGFEKLEDADTLVKTARQAQESQKSELTKAQEKIVALEKLNTEQENKHKKDITKAEVKLVAAKLGIVDPDAAYLLLDLDSIEYDEKTGQPKNIEQALKDLIGKKAYLVGTGGGSSTTNPASNRTGTLTLDDVKKMSQDEINRRWAEVSAVLSGKK